MESSMELNYARNIINVFLSSSNHYITQNFLYPVDSSNSDYKDYYSVIKEPICLTEIKNKMDELVYSDIKEFVCDFRLLFFNCYRYFGCESKIGKLGAKFESMFEQKLVQLPITVRSKTTLDSILEDDSKNEFVDCVTARRRHSDRSLNDARLSMPIKSMMDELEKFGTISYMFLDNPEFQNDPALYIKQRLQKWQEKRNRLQLIRTFDEWFKENTYEYDRKCLYQYLEFYDLVQLIRLTYYSIGLDQLLEPILKVEEIQFEDIEYALYFPRSSKFLAGLVALTTVHAKYRLNTIKGGLPDYDTWNGLLNEKLKVLYRNWNEKGLKFDSLEMLRRWNIEERFFKILGHSRSPLDKRKFHELSIWQRCSILVAMILITLRQQDSIRVGMDRSVVWAEQQMVVLGEEGDYQYVRFPALGIYAGFYIFRIKKVEIDPDLALYSVPEIVPENTRRRKKEKSPDRFRLPKWYIEEKRKEKAAKRVASMKSKNKKRQKSSTDSQKYGTRSRSKSNCNYTDPPQSTESMSELIGLDGCINDENKVESVEIKNETVNIKLEQNKVVFSNCSKEMKDGLAEMEQNEVLTICADDVADGRSITGTSGTTTNKNLDQNESDVEGSIEDIEPPELTEPIEEEIELLSRDLLTISNLEKSLSDNLNVDKMLLEKVQNIRCYFEDNESKRVELINMSRLRLRQEVEEEHRLESLKHQQKLLSAENQTEILNEDKDQKDESKQKLEDIEITGKRQRIVRNSEDYRYYESDEDQSDEVDDKYQNDDDDDYTENELAGVVGQSISRSERYEKRTRLVDLKNETRLSRKRFLAQKNNNITDNNVVDNKNISNSSDHEAESAVNPPPRKVMKVTNYEESSDECTSQLDVSSSEKQLKEEKTAVTANGDSTQDYQNASNSIKHNDTKPDDAILNHHSTTIQPTKVKRRVYKVKENYFTDDLQPVSVRPDGSLIILAKESVGSETYDLAKRMINMYKISTSQQQQQQKPKSNGSVTNGPFNSDQNSPITEESPSLSDQNAALL